MQRRFQTLTGMTITSVVSFRQRVGGFRELYTFCGCDHCFARQWILPGRGLLRRPPKGLGLFCATAYTFCGAGFGEVCPLVVSPGSGLDFVLFSDFLALPWVVPCGHRYVHLRFLPAVECCVAVRLDFWVLEVLLSLI